MNESIFNASGAGNQEGNGINNLVNNAPKGYNAFDESYNTLFTERFADITPSFVMDCPADSYIKASFPHQQRSTALVAPVMQEIKKDKSVYRVPLSSIYHRTFSKFFTVPSKGDDVPDDVFVGCSYRKFALAYNKVLSTYFSVTTGNAGHSTKIFSFLALMFYFTSNGSLFSYLRQPLGTEDVRNKTDRFIDEILQNAVQLLMDSDNTNVQQIVKSKSIPIMIPYGDELVQHPISSSNFAHTFRSAVYFLIQNPSAYISPIVNVEFIHALYTDNLLQIILKKKEFPFDLKDLYLPVPQENEDYNINFHRLVAYQQVVAQYYSNEVTDFIYSEELWRNACDATFIEIAGSLPTFMYNGFTVLYDAFSSNWNNAIFDATIQDGNLLHDKLVNYFSLLCTFGTSLTFSDYFTGSRTRQLAVADVLININGNDSISAVEIAEKMAMARFAHAVNKTSQQLYDYLKGIFGVNMKVPDNMPVCLSQSQYGLNNSVVTNVANNQGEQTSVYSDSSDTLTYEFYNSVPCILLCLDTYQYIQHYSDATDRHCYHSDRMDMFQPYLQTIGDQSIMSRELSHSFDKTDPNAPFGWQVRHAEYKVRFSNKCGGFVHYLPGWSLRAIPVINVEHIHPYFVRNSNALFDDLYSNLPFYSPAGYSHFQVSQTNSVTGIYNMIRKPQIL